MMKIQKANSSLNMSVDEEGSLRTGCQALLTNDDMVQPRLVVKESLCLSSITLFGGHGKNAGHQIFSAKKPN